MTAFSHAEVNCSEETGDGFQITFAMGKCKQLDYSLMKSGDFAVFNRVILAVVLGVVPEVLIDGVITNHQVSPGNDPGMSTFTVTGRDISQMMDLEESNEPYPNQTDSTIVENILNKYARYGVMPKVTKTTGMRPDTDGVSWKQGTNLGSIRQLAKRNGFVFYIEPTVIGCSLAYWGPKVRAGGVQPALSIGLDGATNVKSLGFGEEGLASASVKAGFIEPFSKTAIQLPPLPPIHVPPMAGVPTQSKKVSILRNTANKGAPGAMREMAAAMNNQPEAVTGQGEVDTVRYGHVLRARRLVGVRGAGLSYDGMYYVKSVSHTLSIGHYTQSFSLCREGTGALAPVVMV
jgi:hypothetical protein